MTTKLQLAAPIVPTLLTAASAEQRLLAPLTGGASNPLKSKRSEAAGAERPTFAQTLQRKSKAEGSDAAGEAQASVTPARRKDASDEAADEETLVADAPNEDGAADSRDSAIASDDATPTSSDAAVEDDTTSSGTPGADDRRLDGRTDDADAHSSEAQLAAKAPDTDTADHADAALSADKPAAAALDPQSLLAGDEAPSTATNRDSTADPAVVAPDPRTTGATVQATQTDAPRTPASVSRQIAELTRRPLTVDSLNELLLTIDPSVAKRLLRPSSIHASSLAGNGEFKPASTPMSPRVPAINGPAAGLDAAAGIAGLSLDAFNTTPDARGASNSAPNTNAIWNSADAASASKSQAAVPASAATARNTEGRSAPADAARNLSEPSRTSAALAQPIAIEASAVPRTPAPQTDRATAAPSNDTGAARPLTGVSDARSQSTGLGLNNTDTKPAPAREPSPSFEAQMQRGLASAVNQRGGSLLMRLQPEALGQLRIHLDITDAGVNVRMDASSEATVDALRELEAGVRESLDARGLKVDRVEVRLDSSLTPSSVEAKAADAPRETAQPSPQPTDAAADNAGTSGTFADGQSGFNQGQHSNGGSSRDSRSQRFAARAPDPVVPDATSVAQESLNVITRSRVHVLA